MEFNEAHKELLQSGTFNEWQKKNPKAYLAHFFAQLDVQLRPLNWEVGYYDAGADLITTFAVNEQIAINPQAEVFKKDEKVKELKIDSVKVPSEDAMHIAREFQMKEYRQHPPMRGFVILQNITEGTVWNVTFITQTFAALNIKLDSVSGAVVSHNLVTFFDMSVKP